MIQIPLSSNYMFKLYFSVILTNHCPVETEVLSSDRAAGSVFISLAGSTYCQKSAFRLFSLFSFFLDHYD